MSKTRIRLFVFLGVLTCFIGNTYGKEKFPTDAATTVPFKSPCNQGPMPGSTKPCNWEKYKGGAEEVISRRLETLEVPQAETAVLKQYPKKN